MTDVSDTSTSYTASSEYMIAALGVTFSASDAKNIGKPAADGQLGKIPPVWVPDIDSDPTPYITVSIR